MTHSVYLGRYNIYDGNDFYVHEGQYAGFYVTQVGYGAFVQEGAAPGVVGRQISGHQTTLYWHTYDEKAAEVSAWAATFAAADLATCVAIVAPHLSGVILSTLVVNNEFYALVEDDPTPAQREAAELAAAGGVGGPFAAGLGSSGPDGEPSSTPPPPRTPGQDCISRIYVRFQGLPITAALRTKSGDPATNIYDPGSNGMQAPLKVYRVEYPENAEHTGLDFSAAPIRTLLTSLTPTTDGASLPSGSAPVTYEVVPGFVAGYRTPPRTNYGGGCGTAAVILGYAPDPGPGLLKAPVRVQLSEDSTQLFQDNRTTIDYLESNSVELHTPYRIGTETAPDRGLTAFEFVSSSLDRAGGLVTYTGQTLLGRLANEYPFPSGYFSKITDAPHGYTPREALEALLYQMRGQNGVVVRDWLGWEELPELFLRGAGGPILPTLDALTIDKPDKAPGQSAQDVLKSFFEPFTGYGFRVSRWGRLEVTVPPWQPITSATVRVTQADTPGGATVIKTLVLTATRPRLTVSILYLDATGTVQNKNSTEATVDLTASDQVVISGEGTAALFPIFGLNPGDTAVTISARYSDRQVTLTVEGVPNAVFTLSAVAYDATPRPVDATLTDADLGQGGTVVLDESTIANVVTITSQGYVFANGEVLSAASARLGTHYEASGLDVGTGTLWPLLDNVQIGGDSISIVIKTKVYMAPGLIGSSREFSLDDRTITLPMRSGGSVTEDFHAEYSFLSSGNAKLTLTWKPASGTSSGGVLVTVARGSETAPTQYNWLFELSGTASKFGKSGVEFTGSYSERNTDLAGAAASRDKYGRRELTLTTGVFQVGSATLQHMARALVQDRMYPKALYTLPINAPYTLKPWQKYLQVGNLLGLVTAWNYSESHTPQQSQSEMSFTFAVEKNLALDSVALPDGSTLIRATERRYSRARYGFAHTETS